MGGGLSESAGLVRMGAGSGFRRGWPDAFPARQAVRSHGGDRTLYHLPSPGSLVRRRFGYRLRLAAAVLLVVLPAHRLAGQTSTPEQQLRQLLTALPQPGVACSALIVDLETGATLCDVEAGRRLIPASNAKLLVIAAAIDHLGPDFAFRTVLARQGDDLVLVGDGDPALGDEKVARAGGETPDSVLYRWADRLLAAGITTVAGDLVIDESVFDDQFIHPTWEPADLDKWYAAPVGGLNFNDNCVDVTIWPAEVAGAPVLWESVPKFDLLELDNRCKSGGQGKPIIHRPNASFRLVISGRCPKRWEFPAVPAPDPGLLTASALRTALAERGVTIGGTIARRRVRLPNGDLPASCQILSEQVTPLADVLARTGQDSQNLFAECLLKRLGYEWAQRTGQADPHGSWANGRAALEEFLRRATGSSSPAVPADGSGLSRESRVASADMVAVLRYMHRHPQRQLLVDSLSLAGHNGSLRKRMKNLSGTVHAKTGYLRGVRTLSGYVVTPKGRWRAFSVLFNGFKGGSAPYNKIHDQVCHILAQDLR